MVGISVHGSHPIELLAMWHHWDSCRTGKKKRRELEVGFGEARWAVGASLLLPFFYLKLLLLFFFLQHSFRE
jgi:hypothetical protein